MPLCTRKINALLSVPTDEKVHKDFSLVTLENWVFHSPNGPIKVHENMRTEIRSGAYKSGTGFASGFQIVL